MKIKCVNCGKKFNVEKYSNICPTCSTYNKTYDNWLGRELTPEEQAEYDAKYNREPMVYDQYDKYIVDADRLLPDSEKKEKVYKFDPKLILVWAFGIIAPILIIYFLMLVA